MKTIEMCPNCGLEVAFDEADRGVTLCPRCENPISRISPPTDSARVTLLPVHGSQAGLQPLRLMCGTHTLGRKSPKSTATMQIDVSDLFMSKRHTQVSVMESYNGLLKVMARDAGSSNGTFINNRRLEPREEKELHNGDVLRMGNTSFSVFME